MLTESVVIVRAGVLALLLTMLSGCGTLYVAQAARGQWQVMHARRPIAKVIGDPSTPQSVKGRLTEVSAARDFASHELALPDNESYRTYADVKRPYVVWNVVAAPEFSVEPKRWCFPIAGCVAYRGYFAEAKARKFARGLRDQGFDVFVGGVPAYSTLGKFADPVLNTMLGYGDSELAAIVFHELSHQLIYVAGDSEFNEAFATTVEETGLQRWLKARGHEDQLQRYTSRRARQQQFIALFTRTRSRLAKLYAQKLPVETMREQKKALFASLDSDLRDLEKRLGVRSGYRDWAEEGLNNAHLASVATYYDCVPGFERLLNQHGGDLPSFYAAVRELARKPREERHAQLCRTLPPPAQPFAEPPSGERPSASAPSEDQSNDRR